MVNAVLRRLTRDIRVLYHSRVNGYLLCSIGFVNLGGLEGDHVIRWKWRTMSLRRHYPQLRESRALVSPHLRHPENVSVGVWAWYSVSGMSRPLWGYNSEKQTSVRHYPARGRMSPVSR